MLFVKHCTIAGFSRLLTASALIAFSTQAAATQWSIKDLGTLPGGTFTIGSGINDSGQVVGSGDLVPQFNELGERTDRPFAFISAPNGGPLTLIDSGPPEAFLSNFSTAAVNNEGRVVGTALQGSSFTYAFITGADGMSLDYVTGDPNTSGFARSVDINDEGDALFQRSAEVLIAQADGTVTEVRNDTNAADAVAINNAGQVALNFDSPTGQNNGYVWSEASGFHPVRADGTLSHAYDINNAGQVLGAGEGGIFIAEADGVSLSFLSLPDDTTINTNRGFPTFNDVGQVIGLLQPVNGDSFAFVTGSHGTGFTNLEILPEVMQAGFSDLRVTAINNLGQLTGSGIVNGTVRAFLLSPVPEPETYALMLAGLGLLGGVARRRKAKLKVRATS